jgi:hypothetical protein
VLTAMKPGNDALTALSLQFFKKRSSFHHFIAMIFDSGRDASSLLLFNENQDLTLHRHYFLKRYIA